MPLKIIRQDITKIKADAIVNTTNEEMVGYSGVDYAIHMAAGNKLDEACIKLAPLELGETKITKGYNLACKYIIHTVGPIWQGGNKDEREMLKNCYTSCLSKAYENKCESVAFPLISSGAYSFPKNEVLKIATAAISEFLFSHEIMVYLCVFDRKSYEFSKKLFFDISEYIDDEYVSFKNVENFLSNDVSYTESKPIRPNKRYPEPMYSMPMQKSCQSVPQKSQSLEDYLKKMDKGFADTLFRLIDEKGMKDVECYKKANVDKKTFSKIKCNKNYRPSKPTVIAFAIALELNLDETEHLLNTVGLSLSHSNKFDVIIEYFIINGKYNIFEINEALFEFDQMLLGC